MNNASSSQRLNICIVSSKFSLLGDAADFGFLWPIAKNLATQHNITVLSWRNRKGLEVVTEGNVKAYFLGHMNAIGSFAELAHQKFQELHDQMPFDIVHSIDASALEIGLHKKRYQVAMAYDVRATRMAQLFAIIGISEYTVQSQISTGIALVFSYLRTYFSRDRKLLKTADAVFVTSPLQKLILERHYYYPDSRTYLVPYGIQSTALEEVKDPEAIKKKFDIPVHSKVVITTCDMSTVTEVKNILRAFEIMAIKKSAVRLIIFGNGPRKSEIEYTVLSQALGGRVIFASDLDNFSLSEGIQICDVFINLDGRSSGFEASLLEAMSQKKIIIGSELNPISTIVDDGVDGFLIRPADKTSLGTLLIGIFTGVISIEDIGENARKKVMNIFNVNKMSQQIVDAYQKTLQRTSFYKKRQRKMTASPSKDPLSP